MQLNHWIVERFTEFQQKTAMIWNGQYYSYTQFLDLIQTWHARLEAHSIGPGEVVALCGDYSPNTAALLFALFLNNNIIVPLSSYTSQHQRELMYCAQVQITIEFDTYDDFTLVRHGTELTHPLLFSCQAKVCPTLILFSSGSTGKSKAMVLDVAKMLEKHKTIRPNFRTLVFLLLDHIGGINTIFHMLLQGGTLITISTRDVKTVCQAIETYRIELLPTTPTFLNMLLISGMDEQYDLSSLKLVTYGTELMPSSALKKLNQKFSHVQFKQTYGMSELGILPTKSERSDSLWLLLGNAEVKYKVVNNLLYIKADTAMLGYLNAPHPFDEEGWFITGDVVETKQVGYKEYLRILGRQSEMINVGGEKVYPSEVEDVLLQIPNIEDVVVSGKSNPVTGNIVVAKVKLCVEENAKQLKHRIDIFCKQILEPYKIPVLVEVVTYPLHSRRYKKNRVNKEEIVST